MINNVNGIQPPAGLAPIEPAQMLNHSAAAAAPADVSDVVEISAVARLAAKVQQIPDVRTELVERVKAEIAAGTYETPERMEVAVNRLMEDLFIGM
jgi:negative regulator of flagellin synthesis FlgM